MTVWIQQSNLEGSCAWAALLALGELLQGIQKHPFCERGFCSCVAHPESPQGASLLYGNACFSVGFGPRWCAWVLHHLQDVHIYSRRPQWQGQQGSSMAALKSSFWVTAPCGSWHSNPEGNWCLLFISFKYSKVCGFSAQVMPISTFMFESDLAACCKWRGSRKREEEEKKN